MLVPIVLVLVLLVSVQSCPSGGDRVWVELGDSCYSTSQMAMDWGTAQEVSLVQYSPNADTDRTKTPPFLLHNSMIGCLNRS